MRTALLLLMTAALSFAQGVKLQPLNEPAYTKLIASHKGKVVLVDFWATWCKPCRAEMPELVKMKTRLAAKGLVLLTVSADEPEKEAEASKFAAQMGVTAPAYIRKVDDDEKFVTFVDPKWSGALPALMLHDRTGKRVKSFYGETPIQTG